MNNPRTHEEVIAEAIRLHWIYPLQNTPLIVFAPPMTRLMTALKRVLVANVAAKSQFDEWIFPRMVPEEVLAKTGWLTNHREEAWLLSPKRESQFSSEERELFPRRSKFPAEPLPYALDPIQCVSLYYAMHSRVFAQADLPLRAYETQGGWSFRYENKPEPLTRGFQFLRLELVWIAGRDEAIEIRNTVVADSVQALQSLGLDVMLAEGDSCFEEPSTPYDAATIVAADKIDGMLDYQALDILLRGPEGLLEVASSARHQLLTRRFNISAEKADGRRYVPWSGCLGIGLTRVASAFLAMHWFDQKDWPWQVTSALQK